MTCSLETYRARIGRFQSYYLVKPYSGRAPSTSSSGHPPSIYIITAYLVLLLSNYYVVAATSVQGCEGIPRDYRGPGSGTSTAFSEYSTQTHGNVAQIWDPGINWPELHYSQYSFWKLRSQQNTHTIDLNILTPSASHFSRIPSAKLNKLVHITNGNRGQRGKGITCLYWNKRPSFLSN